VLRRYKMTHDVTHSPARAPLTFLVASIILSVAEAKRLSHKQVCYDDPHHLPLPRQAWRRIHSRSRRSDLT